jgi:zinc transport system permease protein
MEILHALSYGFIQRGLIAGVFISVLCAVLGLFLVLRRFSLIGDGLAHVTFGTVAIGIFFGVYPVYVSIPLVCLSSLGILKLTERTRVYSDAAIGIVSSLGISLGIIFASIAGGFNVDLFNYLFGNILVISNAEVAISIALSAIVISVVSFFYHDLVSVTFDREYAQASGINTRRMNRILVILTSLTVVLAMKVVGIMLVSSLLILPAVCALQIARGFKFAIILSAAVAVFSVVVGIVVSFFTNLPAGATIILINFICFIGAVALKKCRGRFSFRVKRPLPAIDRGQAR